MAEGCYYDLPSNIRTFRYLIAGDSRERRVHRTQLQLERYQWQTNNLTFVLQGLIPQLFQDLRVRFPRSTGRDT